MKYVWPILIAIVLLVGGAGWWFFSRIHQPIGKNNGDVALTIAKGEGVRVIGDRLYEKKLIRARWEWNAYIILTDRRSGLLAGDYVLNRGMNVAQIAAAMTDADLASDEVTVKIREGMSTAAVAALLEQKGVISADLFLAAVATHDTRTVITDATYDVLAGRPAAAGLDGFLFPDTYRFFKHSTASAVLRKFLDTFSQRFSVSMITEAQAQGRSVYDVLILASILEAELQTPNDRAMAADIFLRRIKAGMPLNADTTILYALGGKKTALTLDDLKVDSPYNTYTHQGLPPGPINNPGLGALTAALRPVANDYWYYLTTPTGATAYAKTLAEHAQNKQKYLR